MSKEEAIQLCRSSHHGSVNYSKGYQTLSNLYKEANGSWANSMNKLWDWVDQSSEGEAVECNLYHTGSYPKATHLAIETVDKKRAKIIGRATVELDVCTRCSMDLATIERFEIRSFDSIRNI